MESLSINLAVTFHMAFSIQIMQVHYRSRGRLLLDMSPVPPGHSVALLQDGN
jgi:hypothetical protein